MKILLLDIESSPNTAHLWGLWNQNVSIGQLLESSYILCWAAKWLENGEMIWMRAHGKGGRYRKHMLRKIHKLLDEADAVIHFNGTRFDIPTLNKEFIVHHMPQPAPYKHIDLLKVARKEFKFTSNKLDYIVKFLGVGRKIEHRGHQLWLDCMENKQEAWNEMQRYNQQDVVILEKLYYRLRPWIKNHANQALYEGKKICTNCASPTYQKRGYMYTLAGKFQRYQCVGCGAWFRDNTNLVKGVKVVPCGG